MWNSSLLGFRFPTSSHSPLQFNILPYPRHLPTVRHFPFHFSKPYPNRTSFPASVPKPFPNCAPNTFSFLLSIITVYYFPFNLPCILTVHHFPFPSRIPQSTISHLHPLCILIVRHFPFPPSLCILIVHHFPFPPPPLPPIVTLYCFPFMRVQSLEGSGGFGHCLAQECAGLGTFGGEWGRGPK